jgi:hypothetical protein
MKKFQVTRKDLGYQVQLQAVDEEHARDIIAAVHGESEDDFNYSWASKCLYEEISNSM